MHSLPHWKLANFAMKVLCKWTRLLVLHIHQHQLLICVCQFWRYCPCAYVCKIWILQLYSFGDMFLGMPNFIRVMRPRPYSFSGFFFVSFNDVVIETCAPNCKSTALFILGIYSRVCQTLSGSPDLDHAYFLDFLCQFWRYCPYVIHNFKSTEYKFTRFGNRFDGMLNFIMVTWTFFWTFICSFWRNCPYAPMCQISSL